MAMLGNVLISKILGHSQAESAFRPWWDDLEDMLVYGLVLLGKKLICFFEGSMFGSYETILRLSCR